MRTYAFKCPKGKFHMSLLSKRLVGIAASTALLSLVSAGAHAQAPIDVFTTSNFVDYADYPGTSTWKFTGSVILNSIGFVTNGKTPVSLSYTIKGISYLGNVANLSDEENGFQWLTINPQSMVLNDIVTVSTVFNDEFDDPDVGYYRAEPTLNTLRTNVSYMGLTNRNISDPMSWLTNSNLRVSNPSSNVAPEPGSFALALTGGAALLGICIRRRRNAA
jgi:hypothetical protein